MDIKTIDEQLTVLHKQDLGDEEVEHRVNWLLDKRLELTKEEGIEQ